MSAENSGVFEPEEGVSDTTDSAGEELAEVLIASGRLSSEDVEAIRLAMQALHLDFFQAALHIGVLTEEDLDRARARGRRQGPPPGTSLIANVISRYVREQRALVPHVDRVQPGPELLIAHRPDHSRSEKIRALRTELLMLKKPGRGATMYTLLSSHPGEGRSLLCAELAIAFAQLGRRTLLVDADLRRPNQHRLFGSENRWGLSQGLASKQAPYMLGIEGIPQLALITSGPPPPNALELLSNGSFERLVNRWRHQFECVIIDTPAVAQFADGLAVANLAKGVLLLSRSNSTSFKEMRELLRRLASTKSEVLGAVINDF
jgi:receptor protein-tyrosine kinase